jgi:hypothetical protein
MSRKTGAHFQTARTTRSLLKTLGGDDRKVVRQSARSSSKPSDRTRSISASTVWRNARDAAQFPRGAAGMGSRSVSWKTMVAVTLPAVA